METPKLSVEAIEKGTVIDHIPAGKGLIILRQFKLLHYGSAVTVGFNLPSKTQGSKDIIKITGVWLDDNAANRLALFAPEASPIAYYIALAELVAQGYLRSGGNLWVELNPLYATATEEAMLERIGRQHAQTKLIHDLSGKVRFLHLTYCPAE